MTANSFAEQLKQKLSETPAESAQLQSVLGTLQQACATITSVVSASEAKRAQDSGRRTQVRLEPGYDSASGRKISMVMYVGSVHKTTEGFRTTILNAYVPANGYPVILDLDGESPVTCNDQAELEKQLLQFLGNEETRKRIFAFHQFALRG